MKYNLLEQQEGKEQEIIAIYEELQKKLHEQAELYRSMGLEENSEIYSRSSKAMVGICRRD